VINWASLTWLLVSANRHARARSRPARRNSILGYGVRPDPRSGFEWQSEFAESVAGREVQVDEIRSSARLLAMLFPMRRVSR